MKKFLVLVAGLCISAVVIAQEKVYTYEFTDVKVNPATSVKNQARTGTCWCFSTVSFIESELLRMGKGEFDISEMYIVRNNYMRRMDDNTMRRGKGNIGEGSLAHMATYAIDKFGLIPEEAYPGINYDSKTHNHTRLQSYVHAVSDQAVENKERIPAELKKGLLDAFLGEVPQTFTYKGKEYTPQSFYQSLGLDMNDYVEITSFNHHPFYQLTPLEIPDNWDHAKFYNVPLDDFIRIMDHAIESGYTFVWDGDVSERSYDFNHNRIALNTAVDLKAGKVSERAEEIPVTQVTRQRNFENFTTTDDHLMHITGIAKDQEGVKYYVTKNSWGYDRNGTGYMHMSEEFVKAKTVSILVHKNSIPKDIKAKLGIK